MNRSILLSFIITLSLTSGAKAQIFQKTYGSPNGDDAGYAVIQSFDGGYAVAGYTESLGLGDDVYVLKLDTSGNVEWAKTFGGNQHEEGKAIFQTADSGFIIGATGGSYGSGSDDFYLIKTDAAGNLQWFKTYGGNKSEYFEDMVVAPDGGFALVGTSFTFINYPPWDILVVKTDADGNLEWARQIDLTGVVSSGAEEGFAIDVTSDGGFILSTEPEHLGMTGSSGGDLCLIKLDATGNVQWISQAYNNPNSPTEWEFGYTIHETDDKGFVVGGTTNSFNNDSYMVLYKMDSTGVLEWSKTYDVPGRSYAYSCVPTSTGGYAIVGGDSVFSSTGDVSLITTDAQGNVILAMNIGGDKNDFAYSIRETTDQGFVIAGLSNSFSGGTNSDVYILKSGSGGVFHDCPTDGKIIPGISTLVPIVSDGVLTIDDPATIVEVASVSTFSPTTTLHIQCPLATGILETTVEEEMHNGYLLNVNEVIKLPYLDHYFVYKPDGSLYRKGYGNEISLPSAGFYLLVAGSQRFKVIMVEK